MERHHLRGSFSDLALSYVMIVYFRFRSRWVFILAILSLLLLGYTYIRYSPYFAETGSPIVDLGYARYEGNAFPNGVTKWLGMRYAAPPVGNLRFARPHDPVVVSGVQPAQTVSQPLLGTMSDQCADSSKYRQGCLKTHGDPDTWYESEDCLFISVFAPTNVTSRSKLPVFFDIGGGGFNVNSGANTDGNGLVVNSGYNIVVVTFNYRVGPYGFLASKEIKESPHASLNNGLKDQRKALKWVQKHIKEVRQVTSSSLLSKLSSFSSVAILITSSSVAAVLALPPPSSK